MRAANLAVSCGKTTPTPAPAPAIPQPDFTDHHARNTAVDALVSDDPAIVRRALADLLDAYDGNVMVVTLLFDGLAARRNEDGDR